MGRKIWVAMLFVLVLLFFILSTVNKPKNLLLAGNFAIYDQLKHLAPKDTKISMLIPFGQDVHTFRATPKSISLIEDSIAFFYASKSMGHWIKKLKTLKNKKSVIDLSNNITWINEINNKNSYTFDPHYWLSIKNQIDVSKKISQSLQSLFPQKNKEIQNNLKNYLNRLKHVKTEYTKRLKICKIKKLFVTHNAFAYLEQEKYFKVTSVLGHSFEAMPNPIIIRNIIAQLKAHNIKTIFFESFISDRIAITIANEVGINVNFLETLATINDLQFKNKATYESLMLENLEKFSKALRCQ